MAGESNDGAGAPGMAGQPGALPPTAADYAALALRVAELEKGMEMIAPRLVRAEKFMEGAAEAAAKMLPPAARKSFLGDLF